LDSGVRRTLKINAGNQWKKSLKVINSQKK
jgi:hypothetical protein